MDKKKSKVEMVIIYDMYKLENEKSSTIRVSKTSHTIITQKYTI